MKLQKNRFPQQPDKSWLSINGFLETSLRVMRNAPCPQGCSKKKRTILQHISAILSEILMKNRTTLPSINFLPLLILAMLVNTLAQTVHETGHHLVYQVMGHEPVWAFTKVVQMSETTPSQPEEWTQKTYPDGTTNWSRVSSLPTGNVEESASAAAGPLAGLLSAILGFFMARRSVSVTFKQGWLAYVLTISLVAVLYYLRAPMRTSGDEYDIAVNFGIAKGFIEFPLAHGYLTCLALRMGELSTWRTRFVWLGATLFGSILTGIPMASIDPIIITQVDAGNSWIQPVIGYSLPVFRTIVLTFFGVWAWGRWQEGELNGCCLATPGPSPVSSHPFEEVLSLEEFFSVMNVWICGNFG
jgi:hypothetical protein